MRLCAALSAGLALDMKHVLKVHDAHCDHEAAPSWAGGVLGGRLRHLARTPLPSHLRLATSSAPASWSVGEGHQPAGAFWCRQKSSERPCLAKSKDRDEAKRVPQAKSWEGGAGERGREAVALAGEDEEVEDEDDVGERYAISGSDDHDDVAGELCEHEQEFEDDLAEELETRMAESSEDIWEDFEDEVEAQAGDGGDGGGFVLGDAAWAKTALLLAQEVLGLPKYKSDLSLFAFRVIPESKVIRARLDKLSDEYGSPTLEEIESFSRDFEGRLDQASEIPDDYALEVSSPGAERVVRVPQDLLRFMGLPMYVWYTEAPEGGTGTSADKEEILDLVDLDEASETAVFRLADVRVNREKAGKGRGLTKKQKERRVSLEYADLKLVRLYLEI
eukprot:SM000015S01216  [mRNA]  locus=s15:575285:577485:- [translate_table: standard]